MNFSANFFPLIVLEEGGFELLLCVNKFDDIDKLSKTVYTDYIIVEMHEGEVLRYRFKS